MKSDIDKTPSDYKRSNSLRSPTKLEETKVSPSKLGVTDGESDAGKTELHQTKTSPDKQKLEQMEGSVITGKGEVNNELYEKLQTSIDNLSIDADDERDDNIET